jgi:hypothetical protein
VSLEVWEVVLMNLLVPLALMLMWRSRVMMVLWGGSAQVQSRTQMGKKQRVVARTVIERGALEGREQAKATIVVA